MLLIFVINKIKFIRKKFKKIFFYSGHLKKLKSKLSFILKKFKLFNYSKCQAMQFLFG